MFRYGVIFWLPVSFMLGAFAFLYGKKRGYPLFYYLSAIVINIYVNKLLDVAFFPVFSDGAKYYTSLPAYVDLSLNFSGWSFYQVIGNILMTLPIGIALAFLVDWSNKRRTVVTILAAAGIECLQLLSIAALHRIDRIFDVKDIILNVAGSILGLGLFRIFCFIAGRIQTKESGKPDGFWFISKVSRNCLEGKSSLDGIGLLPVAGK